MQVLFLAPDTHVYNHAFLRGLRAVGARVWGIGPAPEEQLSPAARALLDGYRACPRILDVEALHQALRELGVERFDALETIDEPLVEPAALLRERWNVRGLSAATARLCRDKPAMKDFLRHRGIACARSAAVASAGELREFAAREGFPLIVKPVAGFNALDTFKVDDQAALEGLLPTLRLGDGRRIAVEEFVEGHEGFYDAIVGPEGLRHDFVGHYFPGCLEANRTRWISPQIAVTNRIEHASYGELRELGRRVVDALELRGTALHMEWFFGPKGLKFSEIGARPAGEKIWDMYRVANDFDVFEEWALALSGGASRARPSRRRSVGSIQIRPDRDGTIAGHTGVREAFERCGALIYEHELPPEGAPTKGLDRGWLCNTWFRLAHEDFDELRRAMSFLGETVKSHAR
ncbi:MAG: ATPase [Planctomycetes bacterium]|nr:ATPase [Planctomycetota bacterium]